MRFAALALTLAAGTAVALLPEQEAAAQQIQAQPSRAGGQLASFRSDAEFLAFLQKRRDAVLRRQAANPPPPAPPPASASPVAAQESAADSISVTGSRTGGDKITNTQEADVDEGGIVKKRGDLLVILRRGRLFTVSIAGGGVRPIDHINAFPPGITGGGDWYDEMLISGDRIIVIGYSYARGGTEVNRFRLSPDGRLRFEDAYHLRSNDYYSSRNYASRLIGNRLVYYTPALPRLGRREPFANFPAVSRWQGSKPEFRRIAQARDVYIVPSHARRRGSAARYASQRHRLQPHRSRARLQGDGGARPRQPHISMSARPRSISGSAMPGTGTRRGRGGAQSWLYRLPLDRIEKPSAIGASGQPADQFSFREDRQFGLIDVLVRNDGGGDAMWNNESSEGDVALLSVPIRSMGDGSRRAPSSRYRNLPPVGGDAWNFQNRFVGNHILYGGHAYQRGQDSTLVAAAPARRTGCRAAAAPCGRTARPAGRRRRRDRQRSARRVAVHGHRSASSRRRGSATVSPFPMPSRARTAARPFSTVPTMPADRRDFSACRSQLGCSPNMRASWAADRRSCS